MKKLSVIIMLLSLPCRVYATQPDVMVITVRDAVEIARRQAPDILAARHSFRSAYWNYCYYKANYLPSLTFTSSPYFNHQINAITLPDGTSEYVRQNQLTSDAGLSLTQNIPWTGGALTVRSSLQRLDVFGPESSMSFKAAPVTVSYEQNLFGYNSLKWERKIEPLRFEEAKKEYVETLELVCAAATKKFFDLARAQANMSIAKTNYATADTLYMYARGRYDIGTITENEMLQLEVNRLNEESNLMDAALEVDDATQELRSYLGITDPGAIETVVENDIPRFTVDIDRALRLALENSPDIINMERRLLESESNIAYARSQTGLRADVYAQVGLTQTARDFKEAYRNPLNQQLVQIGIRIPILDWGRGRGKVKVARSGHEMVRTRVEQDISDFELNVNKAVKQFNLQASRVNVASRTEETAVRRHEVALRLYLQGKSTILDLNAAISEKDTAKRNRINTLYSYWTLYYTLRSFTLYDFEKNIPITEDYELLIK